MEDIIIVVWVALIIFGSIINAVNKRRQKAMQEVDEESETIMPPVIVHKSITSPTFESLEGESLETIEPEITFTPKPCKGTPRHQAPDMPNKRAEQATKTNKAQKSTLQPNNHAQAHATKQSEQSQLARDFDLEQAVIYSEILKPKYQDYE